MLRLGLIALAICVGACGDSTSAADVLPDTSAADSLADSQSDVSVDVPDAMVDSAPACLTNAECGLHAACIGGQCRCVSRYVDTPGGCVFDGAPDDPNFMFPNVWQTHGSVTIDTANQQAVFDAQGICSLAWISQVVTMPSYDQAEPFALDISYRSIVQQGLPGAVGPAIAFNQGGWVQLPPSEFGAIETVCLGRAAYGGPVEFRVAPAGLSTLCGLSSTTALEIKSVTVRRALSGECPAPSTVENGDLQGSGGWAFESFGNGAAGAIGPGGVGGSSALNLSTLKLCSQVSATGQMSLPLSDLPSPALQFWAQGTDGRRLELSIDGRRLSQVLGTGTSQTHVLCLPGWSLGGGLPLTLALPNTTGQCLVDDVRNFVVDSLTFVNEPACAQRDVIQGGFETVAGMGLSWRLSQDVGGAAMAMLINDGAQAHNGTGALRLSLTEECPTASASQWVSVPQPTGTDGVAVKFWTNNPVQAITRLQVSAAGEDSAVLEDDGGWIERSVCVNPIHFGRPLELSFELVHDSLSHSCNMPFPEESALIDDVRVVVDAACPGS